MLACVTFVNTDVSAAKTTNLFIICFSPLPSSDERTLRDVAETNLKGLTDEDMSQPSRRSVCR